MAKKITVVVVFQLLFGGFFLSLLRNPTSSHCPSSFGLILLTRRVNEGQPPVLAGGMPEITTLSSSDFVIIKKKIL